MSSNDLIVLTLTPDNPSNCSITPATGELVYSVKTEHTQKATITGVRNLKGEIIASSEWRDVLPDKISIGDRKPVSLGDWMKRSVIPFKDDISFVDDTGRKYKWKGNAPGRTFELYTADDHYKTVIARFNRSRRVREPRTADDATNPSDTESLAPTVTAPQVVWSPATLVLTPRAVEIQDTVVTSFLFLEKTHRINETERMSRADILGTPAIQIGTNVVVHKGGV